MFGTFKIVAYKLLSCKLLSQPETKQLLDKIIAFWEVDGATLSGFVSQNNLCGTN